MFPLFLILDCRTRDGLPHVRKIYWRTWAENELFLIAFRSLVDIMLGYPRTFN